MFRVVIAGVLLAASFPPINFWFLAPISIALFYSQLMGAIFKLRLQICALYGLFFFAPLLHWSSTFVGALPWLILVVGETLFFLGLAIFSWDSKITHYFRFAALWVLLEFAREKLPFGGFGWGRVGFSQLPSPLSFYLPIFGVTGLTFLTVIFAAVFTKKELRVKSFIFLVATAMIGFGTEYLMDHKVAQKSENSKLNITLIQGGVAQANLDFNNIPMEVFKRHFATTNKYLASKSYAINPADLIIWPENASDLDPITTPEIARDITALGREFTGDILIGAVLNGEDGPKNAAILYKDNGNIEQYIKRDLAPFGEYIPLRTIAERISPLAKEITDFIPGSNSAVFSTENGVFTPLICFELLDDAFATKTNLKSNFLVSITNNATFGRSSEAAQQFLIARVRAYESRKEAAIVSTTGYTGFIDSKGRVMVQAAQFDQSATSREISLNNYQTPISKNRNFPELLVTAIFLLTFYRRKRG